MGRAANGALIEEANCYGTRFGDPMPCEEWDAYGWDDEAEEYDASPPDDPDDYMSESDE